MWKFILCIFLLRDKVHGSLDDFEMPKYGNALTEAVVDIISNFYINESSTINIIFATAEDEASEALQGSINEVLYNLRNKIVVQVEEYNKMKHSERKKRYNLIFCDTFESFKKIFVLLNTEDFDLQGFYLIIISHNNGNLYSEMYQMFQHLWSKQVINVNILWLPEENDKEAMMYTYYPYSSIYCEKAVPVKLNQFRDKKWINVPDYFPRKMINLHGCVLRVATFRNPPFMIINERDGFVSVDGIDGILLRVLAQKMNFNVKLYLSDELWGEIFTNGSSTGAIRMIMERDVNLTIGYFASNPYRDFLMTSSYSYYTSSLTWAIPPGRVNTSIEKLLKPFDVYIWCCVIVILGLSFATIAVVQLKVKQTRDFVFGKGNTSPNLNVINITLGGSLSKLPNRNFARTLLGMFMLYSFVVQNSYKGGLFKFMQMTLREPDFASTDELMKNNFKFYMLQSSKGFFTQMPGILNRSVVVSPVVLNQLFDGLSDPGFKGALLTSVDHLAYRNIQASPNRFFHHTEDPIMTHNIVLYVAKQSSLTLDINQIIIYLVNGGFIQTWASKFTDKEFLKHKSSSKTVALNMTQLSGAFQLLFAGLFFSLVTFIAEMFFKKSPK